MPQAIKDTSTSARAPLAPVSSGYADVNGIKLYHEIIDKYLADPLTSPPTGAAAASQAAPEGTSD